jgi:hypothetical protein
MKLSELHESTDVKFYLQGHYVGEPWENLANILYSREEAQEALDDNADHGQLDYEERAMGTDGKTVLRATKKPVKSDGGDKLSRHMPPEVHKRNKEFFDKHL